jgi:DnaJ family protein C protein 3
MDLVIERGELNLALRDFDAAIFDFNVVLTRDPRNKRATQGLERATKLKKEATHVDYYALLGVSKNAGEAEITRAYKKLVRDWHPDRFQDPEKKSRAEEMMKKINTAYDILRDRRKRRAYDAGAEGDEIDQQASGFPFDLFDGDDGDGNPGEGFMFGEGAEGFQFPQGGFQFGDGQGFQFQFQF